MSIGWFIANYKRRIGARRPTRYCAMDDYTALILADGGTWTESEVLGNRAVVKVRASDDTLTVIAADPAIRRIPVSRLGDSLSALTPGQRDAIRDELLDAGYSLAELQARFPGADLSNVTLRDVLAFLATRRLKPRYDANSDAIILDGAIQPCRDVEEVDRSVP